MFEGIKISSRHEKELVIPTACALLQLRTILNRAIVHISNLKQANKEERHENRSCG